MRVMIVITIGGMNMLMLMTVIVAMRRCFSISPAFGIKGRLNFAHGSA